MLILCALRVLSNEVFDIAVVVTVDTLDELERV